MATGYSSVGYQVAWSSLSADATIIDGNTATGIDDTVGTLGATAHVTAGVDFLSSVSVTVLTLTIGTNGQSPHIAVEYSLNSTSWSPLTATAPSAPGTFGLATVTVTGLPVAARYLRVSYDCTLAAMSGIFSHAAIREITATTVTLTPPYVALEYAEGYQQAPTNDALPILDAGNTVAFSGTGTAAISMTLDFGSSVPVGSMRGVVGYAGTPSEIWESSPDGVTRTTVAVTTANSYPAGTGEYASAYQEWSVNAGSVTTRYLHYSLKDTVAGSDVAQAGVSALGTGVSASSLSVWNQSQIQLNHDHDNVAVQLQQFVDASTANGDVDTSYSGKVFLQYVDGGTGALARKESLKVSDGGAGIYRWVSLFDEYTTDSPYIGYFPEVGQVYLAEGADFTAFDSTLGLVTYSGWQNATPVGKVPSKAIGATFRINASKGTVTYSNVTSVVGSSPPAYKADLTIVEEVYVGYLTLTDFTIPSIDVSATSTITPQGWGDFGGGDSRHDLGQRYSNAPYARSTWWEICTPLAYSDANPKGENPGYRHENWSVSGGLSGITIYVPCDEGHIGGPQGPYWVGIGISNFDTPTIDVDGVTGHDFLTRGPYIFPEATYGYLGAFGVFLVNPGAYCVGGDGGGGPGDTSANHTMLSAATFDGALNVAWISGGWPGKLKHAVHLGPSKQIGSSTTGWESTQEIVSTSTAYACGLVYLPNGRLYMNYNESQKFHQKVNDQRGTGVAGDWSGETQADAEHISSGEIGQEQSWRFLAGANNSAGDITFSQCRDGQGLAWTAPVNAVASIGRGPICGGAWLGNAYGLLYTRNSDGKIFYLSSGDPTTWPGGPGTDTGFTGNTCGMVRHPSGRLVAVKQASAGGAASAFYSDDSGATWTAASGSLGISPTPPPVIVCIGHVVYVVYIASDAPNFVASEDSGDTWA